MAAVFDPTVFDSTVFETGATVEAGGDFPVEFLGAVAAASDAPVEWTDNLPKLEHVGDFPVETLAQVERVGDAPVESLAGVAQVGDAPVEWVRQPFEVLVVGDLPVEVLGRDPFRLELTWNELQRLSSPLVLSWLEVPRELVNASLPLTWLEWEPLAALVLTWSELPAALQTLAEDDIQRPFGRMTGTP